MFSLLYIKATEIATVKTVELPFYPLNRPLCLAEFRNACIDPISLHQVSLVSQLGGLEPFAVEQEQAAAAAKILRCTHRCALLLSPAPV